MKMMGYQIVLRITRFVILVIRPDYQKFCLRSTAEEHVDTGEDSINDDDDCDGGKDNDHEC